MVKGKKLPGWLPYAVAPVLFLIVSMFYFAPQFAGDKLDMHDVTQYVASTGDIERHIAEYGEDPQWTGATFGGMPSYMIDFKMPTWIIRHASKLPVRAVGEPAILIFSAMLCFWLMLVLWGVNPWVGIIAALAYGFSTYTMLIVGAGHISKVWALAWAPLLVGAIVYCYRGRWLWFGGALAALAGSLLISANHPQIAYYFAIVIVVLLINEFVRARREGALRRFGKATLTLAAAAILAVGSNFALLYYTAQHTVDTTRGGSELATADGTADSGLDIAYATGWSYGKAESFNMLIPNFMGGASGHAFSSDGAVAEAMADFGARPRDLWYNSTYWGTQPGTAGPTYIGAVVVFLAVLGLFLLRGREKWWIAAVSVIALFLAWGHNMMWFTELCFKILPGYNKFRAVSTALVVVQWTLPLLGALVMMRLWNAQVERKRLMWGLRWATLTTGGLVLLLIAFSGRLFSFSSPDDYPILYNMAMYSDLPAEGAKLFAERVSDAMSVERLALMRTDGWRSLLFMLVSGGIIYMFAKGRMKRGVMVACIAGLVCLDLVQVDLRYLSWNSFVPARRTQIQPTAADKSIMADSGEPGFRVADFTASTFADATASYFHRSVGGYHGAKLQRYQDLITRYLAPESGEPDMAVYDLLNTRYIINRSPEDGAPVAMLNENAYGAAWFVREARFVEGPDEELAALGDVDTKSVAVVDARFHDMVTNVPTDTTARIVLTDYKVNHLTYSYSAPEESVAVFSEIYYDKGWTALVDGAPAPYFRADYVLRAMVLPAGEHTVEFVFRAPNFRMASGVTLVCSILILVALGGTLAGVIIKTRKDDKA